MKAGLGIATIVLAIALVTVAGYIIYTLRKDNDKEYTPENCKWSSRKEQLFNRRMRSDNTSGVEGVRWVKRDKYWLARIKVDGKEHYLGGFPTKEQAIEARKQALLKLTIALSEAGEL